MLLPVENIKGLLEYFRKPLLLDTIFSRRGNERVLEHIVRLWNGITGASDVPDTSTEPALISLCVNGHSSVSRLTTESQLSCFNQLTYVAQNTLGIDPKEVSLSVNGVSVGSFPMDQEGKNTIDFITPVESISSDLSSGVKFSLTATIPETTNSDGDTIAAQDLLAELTIPYIDIDEPIDTETGLAYLWFQDTQEISEILVSNPFVIGNPYLIPEAEEGSESSGYMFIAFKESEGGVKGVELDGESILGSITKDSFLADGEEWVVYVSKREVTGVEGGELLLGKELKSGTRRIAGDFYKNLSSTPIIDGHDVSTKADDTVADRLGQVRINRISLPTIGEVFSARNLFEGVQLHFHVTNIQEIERVVAVQFDEYVVEGASFEIQENINTIVVTYALTKDNLPSIRLEEGLSFDMTVTLKRDPEKEVLLSGVEFVDTNQLFAEGVILVAAMNGRKLLRPSRNDGIVRGSSPLATAFSFSEALSLYSTFTDNSILDADLKVNPVILCLDAFVLKEDDVLQVPSGCRIIAPFVTFEGGMVTGSDCVIELSGWRWTQAEIGVDSCVEIKSMRNLRTSSIVLGNSEDDVHRSTSFSVKKIEGTADILLRGSGGRVFLNVPDTNQALTYTIEGGVTPYGFFGGRSIGVEDLSIPKSSTAVYVSNEGDDDNDGLSLATPKKSLFSAVATIQNSPDAPNRTALVCLDASIFNESLVLPPTAVTCVYMPLARIRGALVTNPMQDIILGALSPRGGTALLLLQGSREDAYDYNEISIRELTVPVQVRQPTRGVVVFNIPSGNITWEAMEFTDELDGIGIVKDEIRYTSITRNRRTVTFSLTNGLTLDLGAVVDFRIRSYQVYLYTTTNTRDIYIDSGIIIVHLDGARGNPVVRHIEFERNRFVASIESSVVTLRYDPALPPSFDAGLPAAGVRASFVEIASV